MDISGLEDALAGLAPTGVVTGARLISDRDLDDLHPVELDTVANAVDRRRHEFATGRTLLRHLLGSADPIPVGPTRAPALPPEFVGSLAHDRSVAVAAITSDPRVAALGVDVEPAEPLSDEMARVIVRDDEVGIDAHLAFTLKEAAYKAWSTSGGRMLGHHEIRLVVGGGRFSASVVSDGWVVDGRHASVGGRHIALAVLPPPTRYDGRAERPS